MKSAKWNGSSGLHFVLLLLVLVLPLSLITTFDALQIPYFQVVGGKIQSRVFHVVLLGSGIVDSFVVLILLFTVLFMSLSMMQRCRLLRLVCVLSVLPVLLLEYSGSYALASVTLFGIVLLCVLELFRGLNTRSVVAMRETLYLFFFWLMLAVIVVEGLTAAYWALYPIAGLPVITGLTWYFADMELQFFSVFSQLSPLLLLVLLVLPAIAVLSVNRRGALRFPSMPEMMPTLPSGVLNPVLLVVSVLVSILAVMYPFAPRLNPSFAPLGVDFEAYRTVLNRFAEQGYSISLSTPDRILFDAFMYTFYRLSGLSVSAAIMFLPVILGPLYVVVTYLLGREVFKGNVLAGFSSFFAATSYTVTVGMFAGLYANWLANSVVLLFMWLILRWSRTHSVVEYSLMVVASVMVLLSHTYTWILLMATILGYVVISIPRYLRTHTFDDGIRIFFLLFVNYVVDLFRSFLLSTNSGYAAGSGLLSSTLGVTNLLALNVNLVVTFHQFAAGFLANAPVLLLSVLSYSLRVDSDDLYRLLSCMLGVSTVLVLFGDTVSVQSRVLYVLPFPVMCALGLLNLAFILGRSSSYPRAARRLFMSLLIAVCLGQLNYVLRSMTTLASFLG